MTVFEVTPPRIRGIFRGESSHEEANVWAPSRSPTGRIFVGAGSNSGSHRMATVSPSPVDNGGSSNDSTPRSRDSQDGSVGRYYSESEGTDRSSRAVSSGIASIYIAGTSSGGSEGGGEVVFALARGVATVVTLSALALVMVLLIVAEAVLMLVAEKIGLAPVVILVLTIMFIVGRQMGVPFQSLARVLVFLWAF
ncbi:hypothetical protein Naga_100096g6 [Nannochloropsis gaditana]|uniref:Uncharacterized protein n=1 Tax=Nannochloropsis gaditana TaxID=72520 RepID=W7TSG0_9STRA|nr:hypothetical protein Naga_100096g6 [Nannochloropsis gaditana]